MLSTLIIDIGNREEILPTLITYNKLCQSIIDRGWEEHTFNKNKLHHSTYKNNRANFPTIQSSLHQTARDQASDILKRNKKNKNKPIKKQFSAMRLDRRNLAVNFSKQIISMSTIFGRIKIPFTLHKHQEQYFDWKYTNAQLIKKHNCFFLNLQMKKDTPQKSRGLSVLGVDLGIKNIAVCSNALFFNSKHLKNIKGNYKKLKSDLQSKGTKSAKKKLKKISGKENRFVRAVNHVISKKIVALNYNVFAFENLNGIRKLHRCRALNKLLGNWSFSQLQKFVEYKAERLGKSVVKVNPKYTSQMCSKCGHINKLNRVGSVFKCKNCSFELHADLNASRNIARIGISNFVQAFVNKPNVVDVETENRKVFEAESNDKLTNSLVGS